MATNEQPRTLLTVREAAARIGQGESTVRRKIRDGVLPAVRLGPRRGFPVRVDVRELEQYVYGEPEDAA